MKTLNKKMLIFLFSIFLVGGQVLIAQNETDKQNFKKEAQKQNQRKGKGEMKIENLVSNLTADQKQQLKDLAVSYKNDTKDLREQLRIATAKKELEKMNQDPKVDADAVNKRIDEVAAMKAKLEKESYAYQKKIEKVLTPDQLKELQTKREAFRQKQQEKMKESSDKK